MTASAPPSQDVHLRQAQSFWKGEKDTSEAWKQGLDFFRRPDDEDSVMDGGVLHWLATKKGAEAWHNPYRQQVRTACPPLGTET